jgi:hypothetical protein
VLLIVRSQYRYWVVSKIFERTKVLIKIYILSCAYVSFKINMSLTQQTHAPQFGNLWSIATAGKSRSQRAIKWSWTQTYHWSGHCKSGGCILMTFAPSHTPLTFTNHSVNNASFPWSDINVPKLLHHTCTYIEAQFSNVTLIQLDLQIHFQLILNGKIDKSTFLIPGSVYSLLQKLNG